MMPSCNNPLVAMTTAVNLRIVSDDASATRCVSFNKFGHIAGKLQVTGLQSGIMTGELTEIIARVLISLNTHTQYLVLTIVKCFIVRFSRKINFEFEL